MPPKFPTPKANEPRYDVVIDYKHQTLTGRFTQTEIKWFLRFFRQEKWLDRCWIILLSVVAFVLLSKAPPIARLWLELLIFLWHHRKIFL